MLANRKSETRYPIPNIANKIKSHKSQSPYLGGDFLRLFGTHASRLFGRARLVRLALSGGLFLRGDLGAVRLQGGGCTQALSGRTGRRQG
jgi:hypothetical protein